MKLSNYAKSKGISYQTAWKMWKRGELKASQLPSGTIIVDHTTSKISGVAIYARVSSTENKSNLDSQTDYYHKLLRNHRSNFTIPQNFYLDYFLDVYARYNRK